jgi:preprotein translocase subunit SecF
MSWVGKLSRSETKFDFVGQRRRWFTVSAALLLISALGLVLRGGLNLGLEFQGGVAATAPNPRNADVAEIRNAIEAVGVGEARVQLIASGEAIRVQTSTLDPETESAFLDAVAAVTGSSRAELSVDSVGPTFGALIARRALLALVVFLGAVTLFITLRLEWKMALAAIAALGHDLVLTIGVYAVTGFEVTPATVVAVLTILGYSLYDTVVVFDKVEELVAGDDRRTYSDIVNQAMNLVLGRSINTSLATLLPVGSLLFVGAFIFGASSLREFALALFVGIAAGTYSSIFLAAPLLAQWKEMDEEWVGRRRRQAERQTVLPAKTATADVGAPVQVATPAGTGATPRPPKKRRR